VNTIQHNTSLDSELENFVPHWHVKIASKSEQLSVEAYLKLRPDVGRVSLELGERFGVPLARVLVLASELVDVLLLLPQALNRLLEVVDLVL